MPLVQETLATSCPSVPEIVSATREMEVKLYNCYVTNPALPMESNSNATEIGMS